MKEIVENVLSLLNFGLDLLVNQPPFNLPVPSAVLASLGCCVVIFAVTSDSLRQFSIFGVTSSIVIALCVSGIVYMSYVKSPSLVLAICTFFCLVIRTCEAAVVGQALASLRGIAILCVAALLMAIFVVAKVKNWIIDQRYLLTIWSSTQTFLAADLAAKIQVQHGSLRNKNALLIGFFLMIIAASIMLPQSKSLYILYLWMYPPVLILSFVANIKKRKQKQGVENIGDPQDSSPSVCS